MALSLPANNALFSPIYHAQPRKGFCCCCCGPFKDAVYAASITTIIMQLMIPILGLSGTIDVLYTMGLLENLSHVTYNGMEQLEILEHEAWIFFVILGALVAILTLIPMYGTYKKHLGMIGFGIGLLLTTAISQYAAAALYIKKANEIVCQDGNSACLSNLFGNRPERLHLLGKDQVLDLFFDPVRQLEAVMGKNLDAVILIRIMRSRNHNTKIGAHRARQHCNSWCRHRAEKKYIHARGQQPGGQGLLDHIT